MDDAQIIALFFERNEEAIRETESKYRTMCFHVANNILHNSQDAEECLNDTWLGAWNSIPPTRPVNFAAFLCKIVRNLSLKKLEFLSAVKRKPEVLVSLDELEEILPDDRIHPEIGDEELGQILSAFLKEEKEETRNVFIRKYWYFDSISDIAERYSLTESKVKTLLYRSRNRLRTYLKKEGIEI